MGGIIFMEGIIFLVVILFIVIRFASATQQGRSRQSDRNASAGNQQWKTAAPPIHQNTSRNQSPVPNRPTVSPSQELKRQTAAHQSQDQSMTTDWERARKRQPFTYEGRPEGEPKNLGGRADLMLETAGKKIKICGYCGAENIVPAGKTSQYYCYFCWEKLAE